MLPNPIKRIISKTSIGIYKVSFLAFCIWKKRFHKDLSLEDQKKKLLWYGAHIPNAKRKQILTDHTHTQKENLPSL